MNIVLITELLITVIQNDSFLWIFTNGLSWRCPQNRLYTPLQFSKFSNFSIPVKPVKLVKPLLVYQSNLYACVCPWREIMVNFHSGNFLPNNKGEYGKRRRKCVHKEDTRVLALQSSDYAQSK